MAWGGTTATLHPVQVNKNGALVLSTNIASTGGYSTNTLGAGCMFGTTGLVLTTANDVCQIPIHRKDGKIVILAAFGAFTSNDTFYPCLMIRKPSQSAAAIGGFSTSRPAATLGTAMQPTSTSALGWDFKVSTSYIAVTTTESYTAYFGPVDGKKYSFMSTAFAEYIEVMIPPCTAASVAAAKAAFVALTSAKDSTGVHVIAFEMP